MVNDAVAELNRNLPVPDMNLRSPIEAVARFKNVLGDWRKVFSKRMEKNSHLPPLKQQFLTVVFQHAEMQEIYKLNSALHIKLFLKADSQGMITKNKELMPSSELLEEAVAQKRLKDIRTEIEEPLDDSFDEFVLAYLRDTSQKLGDIDLVDLACKAALDVIDTRVQSEDILSFRRIVHKFYDVESSRPEGAKLTGKESEIFERLNTLSVEKDGKVNFPFSITTALEYVNQKALLDYLREVPVVRNETDLHFKTSAKPANELEEVIGEVFEKSDLSRNPTSRRFFTVDDLNNSVEEAISDTGRTQIIFYNHYIRDNLQEEEVEKLLQYPDLDYIWKK